MLLNIKKNKKGAALYLAIIMMAIVLAIALGLSAIIVGQLRMMREMGYSVVAFYAADSGIESILRQSADPCGGPTPCEIGGVLDSLTEYNISVLASGESDDCLPSKAPHYCIKSVGTHRDVSRAIEITY